MNKINDLIKKTKPKNDSKKQEKEIVSKNLLNLYAGREMVLNAFKSKIFLKKSNGSGLLNIDFSNIKVLTSKQML